MDSKKNAVEVRDIKKSFVLSKQGGASIKKSITQFFKKKDKSKKNFNALDGVSFNVEKGDFFGILGRNGSGKSTLLKIIAEIYQPTSGTARHDGKLVSFIELGVGFKSELSGRENIFLNGALLGFSRKEVEEMYDDIVEFAELERFIDQKLKNYSSGMKVRLAFSVAIRSKADILVLDEVLAVGDAAFKRKSAEYFKSLKEDKKQTVILVTHGMAAVREYCNKAIVIEDGKVIFNGSGDDAADEYTKLFEKPAAIIDTNERPISRGTGEVVVQTVDVSVTDEEITLHANLVAAEKAVDNVMLGCRIVCNNRPIATIDSVEANNGRPLSFNPHQQTTLVFKVPNIFADKPYTINATVADIDSGAIYDVRKKVASFTTENRKAFAAVLLPSSVDIE